MSKYLLNVSITPVQEFIAEARKTRDLWIGSYLLSYLSFKALEPFIDDSPCRIIYPHYEDSPFYKVKKGLSVRQDELQIASLPNHFLVELPEGELQGLVNESKGRLEECWSNIVSNIKNELKDPFNNIQKNIHWTGNNWDSLWDVQVADHWQYMWVAIPVTENDLQNNYQDRAERIQRFLEERKLMRTFKQWKGSTAIKCTQCGHREVIGPEDLGKSAEFWREAHKRFKVNIREGDRLCAVCTIKRFLKASEILKRLQEITFESTRDIAVVPYREFLLRQDDLLLKELIIKANKLRMIIKPHQKNYTKLEDVESTYLYKDEILPEKLIKEYFPEINKGKSEYEKKRQSLEPVSNDLMSLLETLYKSLDNKPTKYYAVLFMDGDSMGKWLSGSLPANNGIPFTIGEHMNRSRSLGRLGNEVVPEIVRKFKSYVAYSGGDDLLALVPLDYVLPLAREIRKDFGTQGIHPDATTSAGIVIAHYTENFRRVLIEGRRAVEEAKGLYRDESKDAFFIRLILSSGTYYYTGYKWFLRDGTSVVEDVMGRTIEWQREGELSPRFIYDILECIESFYYFYKNKNKLRFDDKLFLSEAERLFLRHTAKDRDGNLEIPLDEIKALIRHLAEIGRDESGKNFDVKENLSGMLKISSFIARESIKGVL